MNKKVIGNKNSIVQACSTNYQNLLFRDELERQMSCLDVFDATWVLEFVRDNFTPAEVFTEEQIVKDDYKSILVFESEECLIRYIKDCWYPERLFTKNQILDAAKDIQEAEKFRRENNG